MMDADLAARIYANACGVLLKPDEGVVIHTQGETYTVYNNSQDGQIYIEQNEDLEHLEHGRRIWNHYEGSEAPSPDLDEAVLGEIKH
jgi:hypothetical protein